MRSVTLPAAMLALCAPLLLAQTTTWTPDPNHSEVDFAIRHMSLTTVHGRFGKVSGAVHLDQNDLANSSVQMSIDVTGIDTGVEARDKDLRSTNFFDVAQYPTATFTSTSVQKSGSGFTVIGNLTVKGITKPVTLNVDAPDGPISGMDHKPHMGYSATAEVDRTAFHLGDKYPDAAIGHNAKLTIELDAVKQQ